MKVAVVFIFLFHGILIGRYVKIVYNLLSTLLEFCFCVFVFDPGCIENFILL